MKKRGQISVYIILALLIVVFAIIIYFLYPKLSEVVGSESEPNTFMKACVGPELDNAIGLLSRQGGYSDPQGYILYQGEKIKYLCYTSKYYQPCEVQQPLLLPHVEKEINEMISAKTKSCIKDLKDYYSKRGYTVSGGNDVKVDVEIVLKSINVVVDAPITLTKENTQTFKTFRFGKESEWYGLIMTAMSLVDFESTYGDSDTTVFMRYYPELQLQKMKLEDGSKVYTITNVNTKEFFVFASRGLSWPGGLGYHA